MPERIAALKSWLTSVLGDESFSIEPASDDASFRRYFRVRIGANTPPRSLIAMDAPPEQEDCRPFARIATLLADTGVCVPRVHASDFVSGFLLLDDLGTQCYLDVLTNDNADMLYGDAINALVRMQQHARLPEPTAYDEALLHRELGLFPDWFLRKHLRLTVDGGTERALLLIEKFLCAEFLNQPQVFVHRDYHSRNLMYSTLRNPGIIDFQDAVLGPIGYDLASLLRDVYIAWPSAQVNRWVEQYWQKALGAGLLSECSLGEFTRWFDLTGLQRHLKIAGLFSRLYYRDAKSRYLHDIPQALDYLVQVAARYEELAPLHELIESADLVNRTRAANAGVAQD